MAEKTTIERLAEFMSYSGHKSSFRVFVPTPSKSETMTLPEITELDLYGGWLGWMKNYKGYTDTDIADWLKTRSEKYKSDLLTEYEKIKSENQTKRNELESDMLKDKGDINTKYDNKIKEEDESYRKKLNTPGSKITDAEKERHESYAEELNEAREAELEKRQEKYEDDVDYYNDMNEDIADADPSKDIEEMFDCKYTSAAANGVYARYSYLDKFTGELKEELIYEEGVTVTEEQSADPGSEKKDVVLALVVKEKWWKFAFDHDAHSDPNAGFGEDSLGCPPKGCSKDVKVYREEQTVEVTYLHKKGNRFTYKTAQIDKDSDKFRYYWFINDNATDSVSYLLDIGIYSSLARKSDNDGFARLVDNIPSIKIVEFLPIIGLAETMKTIMASFNLGLDIGSGLFKSITDPNSGTLADVILASCTYLYGYITDGTLYKNIFGNNSLQVFDNDKTSKSANFQNLEILQIPYLFYSKLLRSTTLNTYEFPYFGNYYMNGNGKSGWKSNSYTSGSGSGGILGSVLLTFNAMNIDIISRPTFHLDGTGEGAIVEFEVNLYNYDIQSAAANFLLVNTIVPNNKWILRGIFLQGSCLYDILIPGRIRSFCCKANISVEFLGIARSPSSVLLQEILKHINTADNKISPDNIYELKIPDVYKLKFSFESLIPDNYNTYLFNYFNSCKIFEDTAIDPDKVDQESAIDIAINGIDLTILDAVKLGTADVQAKSVEKISKAIAEAGVNTLKAETVAASEQSNPDVDKAKSNATNL